MENYIIEYSEWKIASIQVYIEALRQKITENPSNAIDFGYLSDLALYTSQLTWYKHLKDNSLPNIKQLIALLLSNCISNENKQGWESLDLNQKLHDLYHFAGKFDIELGELESFRHCLRIL